MAAVTAAMVKELRERTGVGMMDCKKALEGADGDLDRAIEDLRKNSALKADKKAGRTTAEGLLGLKVSDDGRIGAMVEVNIETDFAAKNEKFQAFVAKVTDAALSAESDDVTALMEGDLASERQALVQEIGENINVRRAAVVKASVVGSYLHSDKRKGTLVALEGGDLTLGRDVAMHVTAMRPLVVSPGEVPADTVQKEREIFEAQAADSGKPPEIVAKMVDGRIRKYLAEISLVEQPFARDSSQSVGKLLGAAGAQCKGFARLEVGDGIEKKNEDFADEVRKQLKDDGGS